MDFKTGFRTREHFGAGLWGSCTEGQGHGAQARRAEPAALKPTLVLCCNNLRGDFWARASSDPEVTCCVSVFQAEQIGRSGLDSDEDTSQSALGRGSNVSTNPEAASC